MCREAEKVCLKQNKVLINIKIYVHLRNVFSHTWMCHDVTVEVIQLCSVLWSFHMQTPFMFAQLQLKTVAHLLCGQKKHHM